MPDSSGRIRGISVPRIPWHEKPPKKRWWQRIAIILGFMSVLLVFSGCTTAPTATYYVSTTGSNSADGSADHPWRTIGYGLTHVQSNQWLVVEGGTYAENIDAYVQPSSGDDTGVLVTAQQNERVVVQGKFWVHNADYWTFNGINVTWGQGLTSGDWMVRVIGSHDWRWTNSELWGAHSTAEMGINSGYNFRVDHNYIHTTYPSNGTNQDHNLYVYPPDQGFGQTGTIERNIIADSPNGRGIKIGNGGSTPIGGLTVRYNTFKDNLGPSNIQLSYGASDNNIYRNIFVHSSSQNVTRYNLTGTGSVGADNIGWQSSGVLDAGPGLSNGGGNLFLDPQLDSTFHPQNPQAQDYGRYAP